MSENLKPTPGADPLTDYSKQYMSKRYWVDEQFAEAIRLAATNRQFLSEKDPELFGLVFKDFPHLGVLH